ncbi:MAG: hypothetical protein RIR51_835 [Bacteroidota bacterium]|jgi:uncharacterized membrane protein
MKTKEIIILLIALIPIIILGIIWNELPNQVPMHWNSKGNIDRMGGKSELLFIILGLPMFLYLLMRFIPKIDPKKKIDVKDSQYLKLRLIIQLFISLLMSYILYMTKNPDTADSNLIFALIGLGFSGLGWSFKGLKPNYFAGIRTPWTLENPEVWTKTHELASKFWMGGGILIFVLYFILKNSFIPFISILILITLIPVIYSYIEFKKIGK